MVAMRKRIALGLLLLLGLMGLCPASLFALQHFADPPAAWYNPPSYPGAQQVKVQTYGDGTYEPSGYYMVKRIRFSTSDSPQQVLSFYSKVLIGSSTITTVPVSTKISNNQFFYSWTNNLGLSMGLWMYDY